MTTIDELCRDDSFKLVVANEFFDSLPTLIFSRTTPHGPWREVLVDGVDIGYDAEFRFVQSPSATANSTFFRGADVPGDDGASRFLEVCPEARRISLFIADIISRDGGLFCAADYGKATGLRRAPSLRVQRPLSIHA